MLRVASTIHADGGPCSPLQASTDWTEAEDAALKSSLAAADQHAQRDWDAVAASAGLSARTAVRIHTQAHFVTKGIHSGQHACWTHSKHPHDGLVCVPAPLSVRWSRMSQCVACRYLQAACKDRWYVFLQYDTAAVAAAPVRHCSWSAAENEAVLTAADGKAGTQQVAFWDKACAACPILGKRGAVRCHGLLVRPHIVSMGMQSIAGGHACMPGSKRVWWQQQYACVASNL